MKWVNHAGEAPGPSTFAADKAMGEVTRNSMVGIDLLASNQSNPDRREASRDAGMRQEPLLKGTTRASASPRGEPAPIGCCQEMRANMIIFQKWPCPQSGNAPLPLTTYKTNGQFGICVPRCPDCGIIFKLHYGYPTLAWNERCTDERRATIIAARANA